MVWVIPSYHALQITRFDSGKRRDNGVPCSCTLWSGNLGYCSPHILMLPKPDVVIEVICKAARVHVYAAAIWLRDPTALRAPDSRTLSHQIDPPGLANGIAIPSHRSLRPLSVSVEASRCVE